MRGEGLPPAADRPPPTPPAPFRACQYAGRGTLYETSGLYGRSSVRRVELATGAVEAQTAAPAHVFAEGLALHGPHLLQLSWRTGEGRRYDAATLAHVGARARRATDTCPFFPPLSLSVAVPLFSTSHCEPPPTPGGQAASPPR